MEQKLFKEISEEAKRLGGVAEIFDEGGVNLRWRRNGKEQVVGVNVALFEQSYLSVRETIAAIYQELNVDVKNRFFEHFFLRQS